MALAASRGMSLIGVVSHSLLIWYMRIVAMTQMPAWIHGTKLRFDVLIMAR